jgi:hypothetical protein
MIAATTTDLKLRTWCALIYGLALHSTGQSQPASASYEQARELARACGDGWSECAATVNLANIALGQVDYRRANSLSEEALALSHDIDPISQLTIHSLHCVTQLHLGRHAEAIATLRATIPRVQELDLPPVAMGEWLRTCAVVATHAGNAERAARLFGHDELLREQHAATLDPTERRLLEESLKVLGAKLYADVVESAWQYGRGMSTDEALAEVVKEFDRH